MKDEGYKRQEGKWEYCSKGNLLPLLPASLPHFLSVATAEDTAPMSGLEKERKTPPHVSTTFHLSSVCFTFFLSLPLPPRRDCLAYFLRLPGLSAFIAYGDVGPREISRIRDVLLELEFMR